MLTNRTVIPDADAAQSNCRIELLGGLGLEAGGMKIARFRTHKTAELLAYLSYFRERSHPREILIDLFWPECDAEDGRHSLSMALTSLRPLLEPPGASNEGAVLMTDRYSVGLNSAAVTTDVVEFGRALESAGRATEAARIEYFTSAIDLYRGELLPGYYSDWIFPEQQRMEEQFLQALRQLTACLEQSGDLDRALQIALRSVGVDRLREEAHQEVIRLYAAAGRPASALRQYRELERILNKELDTAPAESTLALLAARVRQDDRPSGEQQSNSTSASAESAAGLKSRDLEPIGGAMSLTSKFYVTRATDEQFHEAIERRDSIVLVKGARQVGKTSLLARGLAHARGGGARVALTHFQVFNASHLETAETLLMALAEGIAEQLDLDVRLSDIWDSRRGPSPSFRRFMRREVLARIDAPLVWGIDEVDRIFPCPYASEVFGLFRSWHDERALEPDSPWERLTLAIAYSTEPQLFITDVNQSPFNVGTRVPLDDFSMAQVSDLNRRYGSPLKDEEAIARYYGLVNGHPYLVRRGLHAMAAEGTSLATIIERAGSDDWIFGEHLRRMIVMLAGNSELADALRAVMEERPCPTRASFYRLRSAGILAGDSVYDARFRCPLYAGYVMQHLS